MNNKTLFTSTINSLKICKALKNQEAVNFVVEIINEHYSKIFNSTKDAQIFNAITSRFEVLTTSQNKKTNIKALLNCIDSITSKISNKKNSFFLEKYDLYKKIEKPEYYFDIINKDLLKGNVIDFGSGKGYFSLLLKKNNLNVISADILDYRNSDVKKVPFIKLNNLDDMNSSLANIDTTILITVLHHISKKNINQTLLHLAKITKKIIIIEDVIDIESFPDFHKNNSDNKLINKMSLLSVETKKDSINLMDFYGNVVAQGLVNMNLPFEFKTSSEWKDMLEHNHFENIKIEPIGFPNVSFHGFFQVKITGMSKLK